MSYPLRTTGLHGLLFLVVTVSFILPVVFGTGALLPVPAAVVLSVLLGGAALVDASYHAFSPAQRPTRGLRAGRGCAHRGLAGVAQGLSHRRPGQRRALPYRHVSSRGGRGAQRL